VRREEHKPLGAVLFDLGNTLVSYYRAQDFPPILRTCLESCLAVQGAPASAARVDQLLTAALTLNVERADHAVWPLAERLERLFPGVSSDPSALAELTTAFLAPIHAVAVVDAHARSVLETLRARGLRVAIVSNTPWGAPGNSFRGELARHGLTDVVDAIVFCVDVGWRKPHAAPFERALQLLGARADEAAFVGDDAVWDVSGALAAGMRPILLAPSRPDGLPPSVPIVSSLQELLPLIASRHGAC
jgi:HAD superfamily hydrolase (TIGR01509 family)